MAAVATMDENTIKAYGDFLSKIGLPITLSLVLSGGLIWLVVNQTTQTDGLIEKSVTATTEMTSAIQTLNSTGEKTGSALKSLEMEMSRRLQQIEMKIEVNN